MRAVIRATSIVIGLCLVGVLLVYAMGYHGARSFDRGLALPDKEVLIQNANSLKGTPYDPLMGKHGNIGADFGFMVCSDVPNIAYGLSGYSLKQALANDFKRNPSAYNSQNGNNPRNPYFHRRARNLYAYFKSIGQLKSNSYQPGVGDLAFFRSAEKAYISHVALVSYADVNGYKLIESAPRTVLVQEVSSQSPIERGWILSGYGKVYK